MKSIFMVLLLVMGMFPQLWACDLCGCSSSGNGLGVLPQYQTAFVGLRWQTAGFRYPGYETQDQFHQTELWGRFYPGKRLQVMGFLPYRFHQRATSTEGAELAHGLGDASVLVRATIFHSADSIRSGFRHTFLVGAGGKLPTGRWRSNKTTDLPANFQLGTGSWDGLLNVQYQARWDHWGFSPQLNLRRNTANPLGYRYGDQLGAAVQAYTWVNSPAWNWIWMPYVGWSSEWLARDVDGSYYQNETGGQGHFLNLGSEFYTRSCAVGANWQQPIAQSYAGGAIQAQARLSVHLSFWIK